MNYQEMNANMLAQEKQELLQAFAEIKNENLSLDMSRGKPDQAQLDLSGKLLSMVNENDTCFSDNGVDCRNYGICDGIPEAKKLFADLLEVSPDNVIVAGNSSLNLMFDQISRCMLFGTQGGDGPWVKNKTNKFLCPVPGYDRHFAICQTFGIEMINIPMTEDGPDMDIVEEMVKDPDVRGIWCTPKYSNPGGVTFSDETVKRFASLKPASKDFKIFWDNAYCIHNIYDEGDSLLNIIDECEKAGNPHLPYVFVSTSKITYPGSGVAAVASSKENIADILSVMQFQTIGHDKLNMLRHVRFFGNAENMKAYMKNHGDYLRPKFEAVQRILGDNLTGLGIACWSKPKGGYFVSLDVIDGCAKRTVELCATAGVKLTGAGATFPYGIDPDDRNIRIAPSYPSLQELEKAMEILCVCVRIAAVEKMTGEKLV